MTSRHSPTELLAYSANVGLVPRRRGFDRLKLGQILRRQQHFDRAGLAWNAADQAASFELDDHLVDGGWRDAEELLDVGLRRWLPVDQRVHVDEGQVLALLFGES